MKKKKNFLNKLLITFLIILMCIPVLAFADDEQGSGVIVVYMRSVETGKDIQNAEVALYKIADYGGEAITIVPELVGDITPNDLIDKTIETAERIDALLETSGIEPVAFATSDIHGEVTFNAIPVGIYYAKLVPHDDVDLAYNRKISMTSFIVAMPSLNDNGTLSYHNVCRPKCEISDTIHVYVEKVWKDRNHENKRPTSINISLYRDGSLVETISLSEANKWKYEWLQLPSGGDYTLKEDNVPSHYKSSVSEDEENKFVVTNVYRDPDVPSTGDEMNLPFWGIMFAVGIILLVALIAVSIERREKKKAINGK